MDRRTFVKGAIGAGLVGAGAAGGYVVGRQMAGLEEKVPRTVAYVGARHVAGPGNRGLPLLPLEVDGGGHLVGRIVRAPEGGSTLAWYRNCGHEGAPGLDEGWDGDDLLRFFMTPDKLAQGYRPWYRDLIGEPMNVDDFPEPGFGAPAAWRSEGESGPDILPFVVLRTGTDPSDLAGTGNALTFHGDVPPAYEELVRSQITEVGFVALYAPCTHFCCVTGWREAERIQRTRDAWDHVFCTCHFAQFDPASYAVDAFLVSPPEA